MGGMEMKRTHRGKVSRGIYRKIGLLFLIACLFAVCAPFSYLRANQRKNVLVLHSYHKGLGWTDRITQGIETVLHNTDQEIELYFEYMDTKRIYDAQHFQNLYELYRHKFRNRRFDLIVSSDDHAFSFLLAHHQELFPDTPVVFCGVNNFKDSMLVGHNLITGVVESFDIRGSIDVALQLNPNAKEVFVIVDKTLSGTIVKELMMQDIPHFKDVISFTFLEDLDMEEVLERVENLSHDSIVFLISLVTDRSGNTFSFKRSCALISEYSAVPIYSHSDVHLGHGIVGGMLNSGDAQGKMAGEMALRILHGEKVKDIPVVKKSPNRYKFDYQQMQRFGTKLSSLPEGSTVINRSYSFYSEHKGLVWSVVSCIAGLALIILILSATIISRRRAEEAVRESEGKYRSLVESTEDSIYLVDRNCSYLFMNQKHLARFGLPTDRIIDKTYGEFHSKEETKEFAEKIEEVLQTGKSLWHEYRSQTDGGYFLRTLSPVKEPGGRTTAVTVVSKDITALKRTKEALRESEERYCMLFNNVKDAVYVYHPKARNLVGKIIEVNDAACQRYGYTREQFSGLTALDLAAPEEIDEVAGRVERLFAEEDILFETVHVAKDGRKIATEIHSHLFEFKEKPTILSIVRDVTERKLAEEEKKKLEAQLQRAQKMEVIGTLAGGVAHDLNNILSGLVSYPELLLLEIPEDSPLRNPILTIQKSGEKAAAIVQDLLTLARRGVTVTEVVKLNLIICEYVKSPEHERLISFHPGVQVRANLEADVLNILGSPAHLSKTVMNLVSNAAEAMSEGGTISISTENRYIDRPIRGYDSIEEGDYVILTVSDTGVGILPTDMERIFEPFYTKKVMGRSGTGLGMAVVWGTVKDHNGYIDIQSTEGKGTTFSLYFPVTRKEVAKDKALVSIDDYMGKGESILVVDDVKEQREIATKILKKLGYSVSTVSSGEEAVDYLKDNSADLLILDMIMDPGIDGLETYKRIIELRPGQKTLIVSGFSETKRVKKAQKLGAGAYVKKPFLLEKIGLAIRAELDK